MWVNHETLVLTHVVQHVCLCRWLGSQASHCSHGMLLDAGLPPLLHRSDGGTRQRALLHAALTHHHTKRQVSCCACAWRGATAAAAPAGNPSTSISRAAGAVSAAAAVTRAAAEGPWPSRCAVLCRRVDPRGKNWNRLRAAIGQPRFINGVPADTARQQQSAAAAAAAQ